MNQYLKREKKKTDEYHDKEIGCTGTAEKGEDLPACTFFWVSIFFCSNSPFLKLKNKSFFSVGKREILRFKMFLGLFSTEKLL